MAKILVIDDSPVIRELLTEYLTECGFTVETARDGEIGCKMALEGNFRLAVCDIHMPRKNGYQVFSEVRSKRPEIHFIMTDSLPDHLAEQATTEGAHCCLQKPFDLTEMRQIIERLLAPAPVPA